LVARRLLLPSRCVLLAPARGGALAWSHIRRIAPQLTAARRISLPSSEIHWGPRNYTNLSVHHSTKRCDTSN